MTTGTVAGTGTPDTRTRLLDVAERLFSDQGIHATSLRRITGEAGVNLAAVNYHFGSKEKLVEEVFARRLEPLNEERLRRLDELEDAAGDDPVAPPLIAEALLEPILTVFSREEGRTFRRLVSRVHTEPSPEIRHIVFAQFRETAVQFGGALARAKPGVPPSEIVLRLKFAIGALAFALAGVPDPRHLDDPAAEPQEMDGVTMRRLVHFVAAGFNAPAAGGK